jgi:hypothetical protein
MDLALKVGPIRPFSLGPSNAAPSTAVPVPSAPSISALFFPRHTQHSLVGIARARESACKPAFARTCCPPAQGCVFFLVIFPRQCVFLQTNAQACHMATCDLVATLMHVSTYVLVAACEAVRSCTFADLFVTWGSRYCSSRGAHGIVRHAELTVLFVTRGSRYCSARDTTVASAADLKDGDGYRLLWRSVLWPRLLLAAAATALHLP